MRQPLILAAFLLFGVTAFAQTLTISGITFSGSSVQNNFTSSLYGSGAASVSGGGSATLALNGTATRDRGLTCGDVLFFQVLFSINSTDSITTVFTYPLTANATSLNVNAAPLNVTAGTGVYAGKGGSGTITVAVTVNSDGTFSGTGSASLAISAQPTAVPYIYPSGIAQNDNSVPIIQPSGWVSIYGTNFAPAGTSTYWNGNFPITLAGVSVTIDNLPAYVYLVTPGQLNVQAPTDAHIGCVNVTVTTPNGTATSQVTLEPQSPSFDTLPGPVNTYVVGLGINSDGSSEVLAPSGAFSFATRPANAGEEIELWGFGFGPTTPAIPAGVPVTTPPNVTNPSNITVTIGGQNAVVKYAALVFAGEYQINVVVPTGIPSGDNLIVATLTFNNPVLGANTQTQSNLYLTVLNPNPTTNTLSITTSGTGSGTVGSSPTGASCGTGCLSFATGMAVTLTAAPNTGSTFAGWSGACSGTGTCAVTMNSNQTVNAAFNLTTTTTTSVTGTAALGRAVAGSIVTLKDSAGKSSTATTAADGSYTLNTTGLMPPFLIQVQAGTGNLYSVSADALTTTIINTHPFTDLIIRSWYSAQGQNIDAAFSNPVSLPAPSPANVQLIANAITNLAQLWLNNAGVSAQFNLISSPFTTNGTGLDQVLDETTVNTSTGTVTIAAAGTTQTSTITYNTSTSSMTVATTTTGSGGTSVSASTTVVPTQTAQQAALTSISTTGTAFFTAVTTNGSQLTATELTPFMATDLLNDGLNQSQYAAEVATSFRGKLGGAALSSVQIQSVRSIDLVKGIADVIVDVSFVGISQTKSQETWFENVAGTWLVGGDKQIAQIVLTAQTRTSEGAQTGSGTFVNTGVLPPAGTVTGARVTDASGVTGWSSASLGQEAGISQTFQPTPTTQLTLNLDQFVLLTNSLGNKLVPAGTLFTYAITPASGAVVNYALPSNVFTTESISITSPTSGSFSNYSLGQPLTVSWTLPTTFPIALVQLNAVGLNGPPSSTSTLTCFDNTDVASNATSGTVTIPATCGGLPVTNGNLAVQVTGVNGESALATVFFQ